MAPKNIPQGRQLWRSSIDFGISQKIFEGKGEISFSATYENYYETQVFTGCAQDHDLVEMMKGQ